MTLFDWVSGKGRMPVAPLFGLVGPRLTGYTVKQCLTDPQAQAEAITAVGERFFPDAVFTLKDPTIEAQALGLAVEIPENGVPFVREHPVQKRLSLRKLIQPDPETSARMPVFLETMEKLASNKDLFVCSSVTGPFTLAGELAGAEYLATATVMDTGFVTTLVAFCAQTVTTWAQALCEAGAGIILVSDPMAVILSPYFYEKFAFSGICRVAEAIKDKGGWPILHMRGDSRHLVPEMVRTGVQGLCLAAKADLPAQAKRIPEDLALMGGLDPKALIQEGTPEQVGAAARNLVDRMEGRPGFILGSGEDLAMDTPFENIDALIGAVKND